MDSFLGIFGVVGVLFLVVIAVLWFFLPFAVFGVKDRLDNGNAELKKIRIELEKLNINNDSVSATNQPATPAEKPKKQPTNLTNVTDAELDAIARLEADGFTVTKYAVGSTSYYWDCKNGDLSFKARTIDELVAYADQ